MQELPSINEIYQLDEERITGKELRDTYLEQCGDRPERSELSNPMVEEIVESTKEVFTPRVIESWPEMSIEERVDKLMRLVDVLNHWNGTSVRVEPFSSSSGVDGYYRPDENCVYIGRDLLLDPLRCGELIDTVVHEMEHAYQRAAMEDPEGYNIPQETAEHWSWNAEHYIPYEKNPIAYFRQPLENDAWNMGQFVAQTILQIGEERIG